MPFTYDPSEGNLLIDFINPSGWLNQSLFIDSHDNIYGQAAVLGEVFAGTAYQRNAATVVQFVFIPEPSSIVLGLTGLLGVLALRRRR